ncbi:secretin N-terminal domain-containing protein [Lignipirellula cremea]|uniref:secretin N-terminal domain-containing protein n=1 Tax=Lignipirellula cremea TaxID=2528010 RepID=UPI0018D2620F|nr:secretin N-terminal domain-containing protein [Lignipirellula cremea]
MSHRFRSVCGLFALLACLAATPCASAAESAFVGILALAVEDDVAEQLQLSDEVKAQLDMLIADREDAALELALRVKDLPPAEQQKELAPFIAASEQAGLALLSPAQRELLAQLQVRRTGMVSLADPETAAMLKLSPEQSLQVKQLLAERTVAMTQGGADQRDRVRADFERRLAAVLTKPQRVAWEVQAGLAPGEALAEQPLPAEQPADAVAPMEPAAPVQPAAPAVGARSPQSEGKLRFSFRYAPWQDVLDWFAEQADLSLVLDAPPAGTFNYTDNRDYTSAQAIDLLNSVLLTKGFTLVRRERMLMLINLEDGIPPALVERVDSEELDQRGQFELLSTLFQLKRMSPEEAETEIKKLLGPQGSIVVLPSAKQILVTETVGNLRTIRSVIEAVEKPPTVTDQKVHVFDLQNISADELLVVARQLLGLPEGLNAAPDGSIRIAVDPLGSRLFVSGLPDIVARFEEILKLTDVATGGPTGNLAIELPQLEVYPVANADPASVLQVMQTLLAGLPDVRLATDPKTGNLVALARPSEHATIRATLEQMQRDQSQVEVIQLRTVDPQLALIAINKLFGPAGEGGDSGAARVEADPVTRQLLIRGSQSQIDQIRSLLQKMGEDDSELADVDRGNVRIVPLTGRAADAALEQMEALWPTMRRNRIRVVTPSEEKTGLEQRAVRRGFEDPRDFRGDEGDDPSAAPTNPAPPGFEVYPPKAVKPPAEEAKPDAAKPDAAKPDAAKPEAVLPDAAKPAGGVPAASEQQAAAFRKALKASRVPDSAAPVFLAAFQKEAPADPPADTGPKAEIVVAPGPGGIVIASSDKEALDEFEDLMLSLSDQTISSGEDFTVYYLKYAKADIAAALLQQVITGQASDDGGGGGGGGGGGLMGDLASDMLGDMGGGLLGSLLGGDSGGGFSTSGAVSITPDTRLNALIVKANASDLDLVDQLLRVIDQKSSPENVETGGKPRMIALFYTNATEVANVVKQVYASRIDTGAAARPQQPSPEDFMRALRGGGGRGGRGGGGRDAAAEQIEKIGIGIDTRSNTLIVTASDPLFEEVKALVDQLDQAGRTESETLRVVTLKKANPELVQRALTSILGSSVTAGTTKASTTSAGASTPAATEQPRSEDIQAQMQRRIEFFNNLRGGGGGGSRGGFGGNRGGGGGGPRGGSSRGR